MFAAGKYLTHGLSIGICDWWKGFVTLVFFGYQLASDVNAYLINSLIVNLLDMEAVVDHMGVVEHFGRDQHH